MKSSLILPYPGRQLLLDDLPNPVFTLHPQNDPVAPVIAHVHRELAFCQTIRFAKIELSQTAIGLYQLGELYVPDELYLHKAPVEMLMSDLSVEMTFGHLSGEQFVCYLSGGLLKE
jgi:hypothetical protein